MIIDKSQPALTVPCWRNGLPGQRAWGGVRGPGGLRLSFQTTVAVLSLLQLAGRWKEPPTPHSRRPIWRPLSSAFSSLCLSRPRVWHCSFNIHPEMPTLIPLNLSNGNIPQKPRLYSKFHTPSFPGWFHRQPEACFPSEAQPRPHFNDVTVLFVGTFHSPPSLYIIRVLKSIKEACRMISHFQSKEL